MLALAHRMQAMLDSGEVEDQATLARRLGFSRARVTQLLDLLLLAPDIQEEILFAQVSPGRDPVTEHGLREVVRASLWAEQRDIWARISVDVPASPNRKT
jgi:ParB-like chromosome segregation protein Spo0J